MTYQQALETFEYLTIRCSYNKQVTEAFDVVIDLLKEKINECINKETPDSVSKLAC